MAAASAYPSHLQTFPTPSLIRGFLLSVLIPNPRVNPAPGLRVWNRHLTLGLFLMFRNMNKSHTIKFIIFPPQRNMKYYRSSSLHQFLHSLFASKVYFSYNLPSHWSNFSYFFWSRKHIQSMFSCYTSPTTLPVLHPRVPRSCWSWLAAPGGPDLGFPYKESMKKADYQK